MVETSTEMVRAEVTDIVPAEDGMTMVVQPAEAKRRLMQLQSFVRSVMVRGEDYGRIPGTQKDTLYKAGAEKLSEIYGLSPEYIVEVATENWDTMFFYYRIRCILKRGDRYVSAGLGSCNTREDRYAWRWSGEKYLPPGIDKSSLRSKRGKFGMTYRIPNDDLATQVNTVLKMAKKRAFVDAVITATRSSGIFTQDLEDMARDEEPEEPLPPDPELEDKLKNSVEAQAAASGAFQKLTASLLDARSAEALDKAMAAIGQAKNDGQLSAPQLAQLRQAVRDVKKSLGLEAAAQ
jgi:hypothetical protein